MKKREIKFRFWDSFLKEIIQWDIINEENVHDYLSNKTEIISPMQFTGKKDSKGKEIYEGDIIEFDKKEWGGNDNIHVVEWDNYNAEWSWGGGSTSDMEWRTVIGNVYENPELIKCH